jgi:membrane-associated phospholipid phosphatase
LYIQGTTFGNALKNLLAMPRPPSPPLWTHHKHEDFGMPSTHTMNSVSMSLFFAYWLWPMIPKDGTQYLVVLFVVWYTSSMFVSRMYLAAHSHVDTISGFLLGVLYFTFWVWASPTVDIFLNTNPRAPVYVFASVFLLLLFHPRSSRPSPSFRYSMSLSGLGLGMAIGIHLTRFVGAEFWLAPIRSLFSHDFRDSILHSLPLEWHKFSSNLMGVIIGIFILLTTYLLVRTCAYVLLLVLFRIPPVSWLAQRFKVFLRWCALPHPLALGTTIKIIHSLLTLILQIIKH